MNQEKIGIEYVAITLVIQILGKLDPIHISIL